MRAAPAAIAGVLLLAASAVAAAGSASPAGAPDPGASAPSRTRDSDHRGADRFRQATALIQAGDGAGAARIYRGLAGEGIESASLYWNWAHVAEGSGAPGEALWALLRARELDPADRAVAREVERLRELSGLDPAELSPQPLGALVRWSRHLHLDFVAALLLAVSLVFHALARWHRTSRWPVPAAWTAISLALAVATVPIAGSFAKPTAVVVHPGVPLADAASPTATVLATLREGEVVPVLEVSDGYLRVQDSSGARGWVLAADLWRLDRPPVAP